MMENRCDISFTTLDGTILRGWFYPAGGSTPAGSGPPSIVISHGFACLKEWYLDELASEFQRHGIASLVYDQRNLGASGGALRYELDPHQQALDVHDAVGFLLQQPGVDANRVGVFGYSYSAAHAVRAGAIDRRIRAVVSMSSLLSGDWLLRFAGEDREATERIVWEDRAARVAGREPRYFPVVPTDEDGREGAILPTPDAVEFFTRMRSTKSPDWENKVTVQSQAMIRSCDVHPYLPLLAPTPLLMLVDQESLTLGIYQKAFEIVGEPKQWETYPGGHFDGLEGKGFEVVVQKSVGFFKEWLGN